VLGLIRRLPQGTPVRTADSDDDVLRALASCANEAVDALAQPAPRVAGALQRVVGRYGRALDFGLRELQAALQGQTTGPVGSAPTAPAPLDA
jgi:eukaryotic-like serine/threonine-protein kinase